MDFKKLAAAIAVTFGVGVGAASAATSVMDFSALGTAPGTTSSADGISYTEDGMTMTRAYSHFDRIQNSSDPSDYFAVIHEGNNGSGVNFSLGGGSFDLLSFDILYWFFQQPGQESTSVTLTSSSGATEILTATSTSGPTGTYSMAGNAGFQNITGFSMIMPNSGRVCGDCPNFAFDNITFRAPAAVPLPAGLPLLAAGLGGLAMLRRSKRRV